MSAPAPSSVWASEAGPGPTLPTCEKDQTFDVAIIGGGFTGLSTAYHLSLRKPGLSIAVLEANTIGSGASGRNGGLVLNFIPGVDAAPVQAAEHYQITRSAIDSLEQLCKTHSFPPVLSRRGALRVLTSQNSADLARARVDALQRLGVPVEFFDGETIRHRLAVRGGFGAVFDPNAGRLNGLAFLRSLAGVLIQRGVHLFEHSAVQSITEGAEIKLKLAKATVRAGAIVLATNGYTPALGFFRRGIIPLHSLVVASEPLAQSALDRIGWGSIDGFSDDRPRLSYASLSAGGRIVFGGGSNASYLYRFGGAADRDASPSDSRFAAVVRQVCDYFPGATELNFPLHWSGPLALTMSRVCTIGVGGQNKNVYYGLGYSGCGITLANLAGNVISDVYHGDAVRWQHLPFYCRQLEWTPPEPMRWIGYKVFTSLTGRSPRAAYESTKNRSQA